MRLPSLGKPTNDVYKRLASSAPPASQTISETLENHFPPHSIELEQAVLGACLVRNEAMDHMAGLPANAFFDPMQASWAERRAVNLATLHGVIAQLQAGGAAINPASYIRTLIEHGDTSSIGSLIDTLADYANRRALCLAAYDLDLAARDLSAPARDAAGDAVQMLDTVMAYTRRGAATRQTVGDAFTSLVSKLADGDDDGTRIPTGLASLDKVLGGWRRKQFAIIAGRPSMGKSALGMSAMLRTARAGHGVLYFSLEMNGAAMAARCLSDLSWTHDRPIPYQLAGNGRMADHHVQAWGEAAAQWATLPVTIDDQRGLTMAEIAARTRSEAARFDRSGQRLSLVIVDHLGLVRPSGRYAGNKVNEVGEISDALATLAKEQDVAVVALHQLNRANEQRDNKRPGLADLRNSGDIEQDADVVCFAYREAYYLERTKFDHGSQQEHQRRADLEACAHSLEVLVAKNRHGPTSTVHLYCDMACNVVRDLASDPR
jgi:replicative DNA helicase